MESHEKYLEHDDEEEDEEYEREEPHELLHVEVDGAHVIIVMTDPTSYMKDAVKITLNEKNTGKEILNFSTLRSKDPEGGDEFLPREILNGEEFMVNSAFNMPVLPVESLKNPREIFGLLHEIGHTESNTGRFKKESLKISYQSGSDKFSEIDQSKVILQEERDAWSYAIRYARTIRKETGVNLFKLFKTFDEFMGWLRDTGLRSYEDRLKSLGVDNTVTKEKQVELWREAKVLEEMAQKEKLDQEIKSL